MVIHPDNIGVGVISFIISRRCLKLDVYQIIYIMKKSFEKSLKLEIKPIFQFSTAGTKGQNLSDPTTVTATVTTVFDKPDVR